MEERENVGLGCLFGWLRLIRWLVTCVPYRFVRQCPVTVGADWNSSGVALPCFVVLLAHRRVGASNSIRWPITIFFLFFFGRNRLVEAVGRERRPVAVGQRENSEINQSVAKFRIVWLFWWTCCCIQIRGASFVNDSMASCGTRNNKIRR